MFQFLYFYELIYFHSLKFLASMPLILRDCQKWPRSKLGMQKLIFSSNGKINVLVKKNLMKYRNRDLSHAKYNICYLILIKYFNENKLHASY